MYDGILHIPRTSGTRPSARSLVYRRPPLKPQQMARMCAVCREWLRPEHFAPAEREALHPLCRMCLR
jgi:hypothetical protein